jgi:hypothetical protein
MNRACLVLALGVAAGAALGACASDPGPIEYTGVPRRFVVDSITLPTNNTMARELALDIDGDKRVDNQLGMVIGFLASFDDVTTHGDDMIAAGAIASSVEILADDFTTDDTVAVSYVGIAGESPLLVGGSLEAGAFVTTVAGAATIHLPVLVDADPIVLRLRRMRAVLVPDGNGGYTANIGGAVDADEVRAAAFASIREMIENRPSSHVAFFRMLDTNPQDFELTQTEVETNSLIESLLAPDITRNSEPMLSLGFRVHLKACAEGACIAGPPATTCFDRVLDGDETDVDCGGSCAKCAREAATCSLASDCESNACDGGTCAAPSCDNGVRDGHETDVDCGSQCGDCAVGRACWSNADCASGQCGAPCSGTFCGDYFLDTCR